ncbi:MAG: signal peptidase II [Patescibacteria group bacterium]|nr:signal peptidase II [Patescibacteria group bacterium]
MNINESSYAPKKMILFAAAAVFDTIILDLVLKYAVRLDWIATVDFIPGVLAITKHENYGLIGNAPIPYPIIIGLTIVALIVLFYGMKTSYKQNRFFEFLALSYVSGGALGNFIDRIMNGYVFDWILLFNTSIINIADVAITLGIIGYVASHYYYDKINVHQD